MNIQKGYIAACSEDEKQGIYEFNLSEDGMISKPVLSHPISQSKYLSIEKHSLVSTCKEGNQAGLICFDTFHKYQNSMLSHAVAACYIIQDQERIYTANYHEGNIMIYERQKDKLVLLKRIDVKDKAGCHQIIFYKEYFLVPCLFLDQILIFHKTSFQFIKAIDFPKGSGPRHGVFNQDQSILYVISELSNELYKFEVNDLTFDLVKQLPLIEKNEIGESAAILLSEDEAFLYITIRSIDEIIVVSLLDQMKVIQRKYCGGKHPRDAMYATKQPCLLIVNRYSNNIVSIKVNAKTGLLENQISEQMVPEPLCVILEEEEKYE
ncbi:MAG: beta-propeller fold lactonase family protein [Erysipelotrichaceae bacterium]